MAKKLLVLIFSLVLLVNVCFSVCASSEPENLPLNQKLDSLEKEIPNEVRQAMDNQIGALKNYEKIVDSFEKDEFGLFIYPDEYAGAYIDNGILIVQLIDCGQDNMNKYIQLCENVQKLDFKEAKYSLNELLSYTSYVTEMNKSGVDVVGYGIREKENCFEIYINVNSKEATKDLNKFIKENEQLPIKILYQEPATTCTTMRGGYALTNQDTNLSMTVGICGTYNGQNALLTCGHGNEKDVISQIYPYMAYNGSRIGQVSYQRANTDITDEGVNSLGDFSIVTLNADVNITNKINDNLSITGTYSSLPEGTTIYKYGIATGLSYGTITQSSILYAIDSSYSGQIYREYHIRGLYRSSLSNASGTDAIASGDSGGPVYIKDGSNYLLHGIVTAQQIPPDGQVASVMFSTPIYYAIAAGFTVKTN